MLLQRLLVPLLLVPALLLAPQTAAALTRAELDCQMTIAAAGHRFLAGELAAGARCQRRYAVGSSCDDADKAATAREKTLRHALDRCKGVRLSRLGTGGCTDGAASLDDLAACLVADHRALVDQALVAEFGDDAADRR